MLIAEIVKKPVHAGAEDETVIAAAKHMRDARLAFLPSPLVSQVGCAASGRGSTGRRP